MDQDVWYLDVERLLEDPSTFLFYQELSATGERFEALVDLSSSEMLRAGEPGELSPVAVREGDYSEVLEVALRLDRYVYSQRLESPVPGQTIAAIGDMIWVQNDDEDTFELMNSRTGEIFTNVPQSNYQISLEGRTAQALMYWARQGRVIGL